MKQILCIVALFVASVAGAQEDKYEKWGPTAASGAGFIVRAGYTIGATTPIPLPSEIRSLNAFSPNGGGTLGIDVYKMWTKRWGMSAGWHVFRQGFHTSADVKNYTMSLTMDGNTMAGYFTGCDVTDVKMWGVKMPVMITCRVSPRWNISVGPFFDLLINPTFSGEVFDNSKGVGYLRVDTPTGEKVNIDSTNPATYDFSDELRTWAGGLEFAFDWRATRHMNVFAMLDWGLSDFINPDFTAVGFKMYPIYGTVGLAYRY